MMILGIEIPAFAVLIGSMIGAFFVGLGMGLGSELGKYLVAKYLIKKLNKVVKHSHKLVKVLYKR